LVFWHVHAVADVDATGRQEPGTVGPECDPQCEIRYGAGGTVTDLETGQPIAGATVSVSTEGGVNTSGTTGADGSYSVGGSTTVRCFLDYLVDLQIRAEGYYGVRRTGYFSTAYMPADIELRPWLAGDCNLDKTVDVSELVVGLQILLGRESLARCAALDVNRDGSSDLLDLVHAVRDARDGGAANR